MNSRFRVVRKKKMPLKIHQARHILVINLKYLGDSLWMLPFVDNLKHNLPDVAVSVAVNEGTDTFFHNHPAVYRVIPFPRRRIKNGLAGFGEFFSFIREVRRLKPDVAIDLSDTDRPAIISLLSGAAARIGYNNADEWRKFLYTRIISTKINSKHMVEYHLDVLRELGLTIYDDAIKITIPQSVFKRLMENCPAVFEPTRRKKILVHPGARNPLRQWEPEKYAALCDALAEDCRIFLVAGPDEGPILEEIRRRMKKIPALVSHNVSLWEFAAMCEMSDMFIGNDSGPIHVASAKTFTVGIYGPTCPEIISPWTKRKQIIESGPLPCRPCRQEICENSEFNACLKRITPDEAISKIRESLAGSLSGGSGI